VFLYAAREDKVRRVMAGGKTEREALELVDTVDHDRIDFIQRYFGVEWPTRSLFHIMLNTSLGEAIVVQTILQFMKTIESRG